MGDLVQIAGAVDAREIIRVFPQRTKWTPDDALAFVGHPPLLRPGTPETPVYVSVTFTWQRRMAEAMAGSWRMYYRNVLIGGPAYDDPAGEFTPGMFLKQGCTITSRGCPKKCGWCKVPFSEGALRELTIQPGWIVQDNNLLACSEPHLRAVFDMLRAQKRSIYFNGGLDKHFLQPWHRALFDSIPLGELWFALDTMSDADFSHLQRAKAIMEGISIEKMRCYTMIGYDDQDAALAERRLERVYELGFLPFCQLYQPPCDPTPKIYSAAWKAIMRKWSRPAAYRSKPAAAPATPLFG